MIVVNVSDHTKYRISALLFEDFPRGRRSISQYEVDQINGRFVSECDYNE